MLGSLLGAREKSVNKTDAVTDTVLAFEELTVYWGRQILNQYDK